MRVVISGGPCSGKSTLIRELGNKGYAVMKEVARKVLDTKGTREVSVDLQMEIASRQIECENELNDGEITFLDRGLVDVMVYSNHFLGGLPNVLEGFQFRNRYDVVFIPDRLPFEDDGLRIESGEEHAQALHDEVWKAYEDCGYDVERVPVMPLEERVDYIIDHLKKVKGGGR
ncbi:MAG: ATP-binding protein [Nanoarchaeota archaeon]|nr:ATP-binding protein [Nanoarchaeota archaeon]MBU1052155.1 ATP-binding protein [Nanoarchaeota archaeon]MBU1988122.1 ATP-binding protein [Nanoarchaeota archaeon]